MPQSPPELGSTDLPSSDMLPPYVFPGYEFLGMIGVGGFGTVIKARQLRLDRVIAIKVIRPDIVVTAALAARFEAEARTLGKLHHPNIVEVYDSGQHGGRVYISMELLEGEDLGQRIIRCGRLGEAEVWSIARQAIAALSHAASLGIIHRDIKPSNLHLVPAPTGLGQPSGIPLVKVTDFGLARTCRLDGATSDRYPTSGVIVGTPAYMAPEQGRSTTELDHRADIYALGSTVYHALTGHTPFAGKTVWDVMARKLEGLPQFDPELSCPTVQLLSEMLAPDPKDRVQTYEELLARIDSLSAPISTKRGRRTRWMLVGALAAAVVAASTAVNAARDRSVQRANGPPLLARYQPSGPPLYLFDGVSLNGWSARSGGQWSVERDEEGVKVLSGSGSIRRAFTPQECYVVTIGVDVQQASNVEVHFGISSTRPETRRHVLRISKLEGARLGSRPGDKGEFTPIGGPVRFPSDAWFVGRRPYLEVKIERMGGWWKVSFHGQEVDTFADDDIPKLAEIQILAEGGPVHIDTVSLTPLQRTD